jgi:hypothetical protein
MVKVDTSALMLPGWRIKITGMPTRYWWEAHIHLVGSPHAFGGKPTCIWWVAPQVVFFREDLPEKKLQKNLLLLF